MCFLACHIYKTILGFSENQNNVVFQKTKAIGLLENQNDFSNNQAIGLMENHNGFSRILNWY